jgi:peroxiredoxin
LRERAALEALHQRYQARGLVVLAVNMGEPTAKVSAYVAQHHLSFRHVLDMDRQAAARLSVPATPTTFLINPQGQILGGGLGYRDWRSPAAHTLLEQLLTEARGDTLRGSP